MSGMPRWGPYRRASPELDQFEAKLAADERSGALKGLDGDVALGLQDAVDLGAALLSYVDFRHHARRHHS